MGEEEGLERMSRQAASIPARSPVTTSELPPSARSQGSGYESQFAPALEIFQERRERELSAQSMDSGPKIANLPGLERMWSGKARWMRKHRYSGDYSEWCLGEKYTTKTHSVSNVCIWTLSINITESSDMELSNAGIGIGYHPRHHFVSIALIQERHLMVGDV
ncbi:Pc12g16480 [Penicillium rubens Wisconsin 54-1255]|uniref:Pc12g16480 protein n=1 Tax=Penicillium rubens (strain ATCC 28089 / DSM 1075 / NRRL 1951 / Wisconsin 54-1255) TaxID=500485 RepID=B6GZ18_PENRW|nr:Pc12g16480 [Penicillium rubens Wisconsin 54-1255]